MLWACDSEEYYSDTEVTFPKEVPAPEGVRFKYLMFENDFNAIPKDGNPNDYSTKFLHSESARRSFVLSNKRKFAPGVNGIITKPKENEWYKISFYCYKPSATVNSPEDLKGTTVISFERGDSVLHYNSFPITELLKKQNLHIVDKWQKLHFWYEVPSNIQTGDRLKIYQWNPYGGAVYFDDFIVEVWTTKPQEPKGYTLNHILTEQNYETSDLVHQTTKETAVRGMFSCVLSNAPGKAQYGKGYKGTLAEAEILPGDYVRVTFAALKKHKVRLYSKSSKMVVSLQRNQQQLFWDGLPIEARIRKDGKQAYGNWVNLEFWKQIPLDSKPGDFLQIYPWNSLSTPIYIDDLKVEVWRSGL